MPWSSAVWFNYLFFLVISGLFWSPKCFSQVWSILERRIANAELCTLISTNEVCTNDKNKWNFLDSEKKNRKYTAIVQMFVMELKAKSFSQDFNFVYLPYKIRSEKTPITYLQAASLVSDGDVIRIVQDLDRKVFSFSATFFPEAICPHTPGCFCV